MTRDPRTRLLKTGEVARRTGVSPDTVRHYERKGLLPPAQRASNGYRGYAPGACERVLLVRKALAVGFSLEELARVLGARDRGKPPCREVRALAEAKLGALELRLAELTEAREILKGVIADWDARLARAPAGAPAGLLEALLGTVPRAASPSFVEGRMQTRSKGKESR